MSTIGEGFQMRLGYHGRGVAQAIRPRSPRRRIALARLYNRVKQATGSARVVRIGPSLAARLYSGPRGQMRRYLSQ